MNYKDLLYGQIKIPDFYKRLFECKELIRLKGISQAVLPQELMPYKFTPSRFQHGIGVWHLANIVCHNKDFSSICRILPIAGLLHDIGNPPFCHLNEPFLMEMCSKDGESFAQDILDGSQTEKWLKKQGFSVEEIISFITGSKRPFSDILNGSIDIDNLDNVARYGKTIGLNQKFFSPAKIAKSFKLRNGKIGLDIKCFNEVQSWKKARKSVYSAIYGNLHLARAMMLYRAVEIAFYKGDLNRDFFFLNDLEALEYLKTRCNPQSKQLVKDIAKQQWYVSVFDFETEDPSKRIINLSADRQSRRTLATKITSELRVPQEKICVYIDQGKDVKKIRLPFFDGDELKYDQEETLFIYRIKIYAHLDLVNLDQSINEIIKREIYL